MGRPMTDIHCPPAFRLINLRSSLWSALGLPPDTSDADLVTAVLSLKADRDFTPGCFVLAVDADRDQGGGEGGAT